MLPGFRFLFAAILLSTSILVFGLGAAALLRATHQQYADNVSWRNGPQEQVFAQPSEPAPPVLAILRAEPVEPPATEATPALPNEGPSIGQPAVQTAPEEMATVSLEPEVQPGLQVAAVAPAEEKVEPAIEAPAPEPAQSQAQAPADTLTPADTTASIATTIPAPTMSATDVPRTAVPALASRVSDIAAARVAALNDLTPPKSKAVSPKPESKPKAQKKKRHRVVRRPPPQQLQQALDPFGQPTLTATAARAR